MERVQREIVTNPASLANNVSHRDWSRRMTDLHFWGEADRTAL